MTSRSLINEVITTAYRSIINNLTIIIARAGLKSRSMTDADLQPSTPPTSRPRKARSGNQLYIPIHASATGKSVEKESLEGLESEGMGKKESLRSTAWAMAQTTTGGKIVGGGVRTAFGSVEFVEKESRKLGVILSGPREVKTEVVDSKEKRSMGWGEG